MINNKAVQTFLPKVERHLLLKLTLSLKFFFNFARNKYLN